MSRDTDLELFDDFTDEDDREEFSNFLRYSNATMNWLRSTIITATKNLRRHGITRKELEAFMENCLDKAWKKAEAETLDEDTKKALEKMIRINDLIEDMGGEPGEQLAEDIRSRVNEFLETEGLEDDFIQDLEGGFNDE